MNLGREGGREGREGFANPLGAERLWLWAISVAFAKGHSLCEPLKLLGVSAIIV